MLSAPRLIVKLPKLQKANQHRADEHKASDSNNAGGKGIYVAEQSDEGRNDASSHDE